MKKQNWIPSINEVVSWGCDIAQVMSVNFGGKCVIKTLHNKKIIRNIDVLEIDAI